MRHSPHLSKTPILSNHRPPSRVRLEFVRSRSALVPSVFRLFRECICHRSLCAITAIARYPNYVQNVRRQLIVGSIAIARCLSSPATRSGRFDLKISCPPNTEPIHPHIPPPRSPNQCVCIICLWVCECRGRVHSECWCECEWASYRCSGAWDGVTSPQVSLQTRRTQEEEDASNKRKRVRASELCVLCCAAAEKQNISFVAFGIGLR